MTLILPSFHGRPSTLHGCQRTELSSVEHPSILEKPNDFDFSHVFPHIQKLVNISMPGKASATDIR